MAYKINGTEVIDDNGDLVNFSAYNLNNDDGQIEVQSNSPMVGTVSGYASGGFSGSPGTQTNIIDKFPFATDTNASNVSDLSVARYNPFGQSSTTHGYASGGQTTPGPAILNTIDKFLFATNSNATDVGNLSVVRSLAGSQSSFVSGYVSGGITSEPPLVDSNVIDKFPFAADANATDVGDLSQTRSFNAGQSSTVSGYNSGGRLGPPSFTIVNTIDKFSFSVDNNASDVGDLIQGRYGVSGQSSTTHGYTSGGGAGPAYTNTIEKFPFAVDTNASDVGDLLQPNFRSTGQSALLSGYVCGGYFSPPATQINSIDKFPFSTDSNATDVGDLSQGVIGPSGQQD